MKAKTKIKIWILFLFITHTLYSEERTKEERNNPSLFLYQDVSFSYNYLSLNISSRLFLAFPLVKVSKNDSSAKVVLFSRSSFAAGFRSDLTLSYESLKAYVKIEPISFFDLYASFGIEGYFPNKGPFRGLKTIANYQTHWIGPLENYTEKKKAMALITKISPTLKFRIPKTPVSFINTFTYIFRHVFIKDEYYHDSEYHVNLKNNDPVIMNESYVFVKLPKYFMLGVMHAYTAALKSDFYANGDMLSSNKLLGLFIFSYPFKNKLLLSAILQGGAWINEPFLKFGQTTGGVYLNGLVLAFNVSIMKKIF